VIEIDAGTCTTVTELLTALRHVIGAPDWHGWNPDAFIDSMIWGGINSRQPPYTVRVVRCEVAPPEVREYVALMSNLIAKARAERFDTGHGEDIAVCLEVAS
jgi:hypothetical protein